MARSIRAHGWYRKKLALNNEARRRKRAGLPRCAVKGCDKYWKLYPVRGRCYCRTHAALYRTHYEILDRIRSL